MAAPTVVTRRPKATAAERREFAFSREMIPTLPTAAPGSDALASYRLRAWEAFQRLPLPTPTDEAWRRTDLRELAVDTFRLPQPGSPFPPPPRRLLKPLVGKTHGGQIVLTPGAARSELSAALSEQGVIFTDLLAAEQDHPDLLADLIGRIVRPEEGKFAALAAAFAESGILVYVPPGVHVEQPLHSVLWGPGLGLAHLSHILVWLDEGASLTYVHEAASPDENDGQTLHAGIVELRVGAGAHLTFVELQSWGNHVWNFSHERAQVERDGELDWIFGAVGSRLTKNFSDLNLVGEGATGRMSGFYFTDGVQHLDHDTQQNHLAPHTTSDLLFKGALTGSSRSVWQGMIYVAPGAEKTDGYQANRNLVLSPSAHADSIPGLEICADDVRCTHGATVGKIDPEPLFYLASRGIPHNEAVRLVVEGFFDPIMQRIPFDGVRSRFQHAIGDKMTSFS